jgi:hypothetical protein
VILTVNQEKRAVIIGEWGGYNGRYIEKAEICHGRT